MYETCRLVRIFDPNFASQYLDSAYVDSMAAITPLRSLDMLDQLKQEVPLYRAAARSAGAFDKSSVADYTEAMLTWWRTNGGSFPAWALAARIRVRLVAQLRLLRARLCAAEEPLRRAADELAGRLRAGGADAQLQPTQCGVNLGVVGAGGAHVCAKRNFQFSIKILFKIRGRRREIWGSK